MELQKEGLNLVKVTPQSWFKSILDRTTGPYTTPKYPHALFYKLDDDVIFAYDWKAKDFWVNDAIIWSVFEDRFGMKYNEILELIESMVEEHYKLGPVTPIQQKLAFPRLVEEQHKLGSNLVNEGLNDDKKIIDLTGIWYRLESNQQQSSIRQEIQEGLNLPKKKKPSGGPGSHQIEVMVEKQYQGSYKVEDHVTVVVSGLKYVELTDICETYLEKVDGSLGSANLEADGFYDNQPTYVIVIYISKWDDEYQDWTVEGWGKSSLPYGYIDFNPAQEQMRIIAQGLQEDDSLLNEGLNLPKKTLESRVFACLDANGRINHSDNIDYEDNVIYISPTTSNDEELMPGWESSTPIKSGYKVSGYQIGAMAALTDCLNMELDVVRNDIRLHRQINGAILDWFLQNKSSALQEGLNVTKRDYKNEVVDIFKKVAKWYRVKFTPVENYKPQDNFRAVHFKFQLPTINNKQALISLGCQYANSDNNNIIYGTVKIISTESVSKSIRFTHEIDRHDIEGLIRVINANVITAVGQQS